MAEPDLSFADEQLLKDIHARKVADDVDTNQPMLDLGPDGETDVSAAVWEFKRRGWVHDGEWPAWRLTQRGLDVLEGRRHV
jgi:hypothetical protein